MKRTGFLDRRNHQLLPAEAESGYGRRPVYAACTTIAAFLQLADCFISAAPTNTRVFTRSGTFLRRRLNIPGAFRTFNDVDIVFRSYPNRSFRGGAHEPMGS